MRLPVIDGRVALASNDIVRYPAIEKFLIAHGRITKFVQNVPWIVHGLIV